MHRPGPANGDPAGSSSAETGAIAPTSWRSNSASTTSSLPRPDHREPQADERDVNQRLPMVESAFFGRLTRFFARIPVVTNSPCLRGLSSILLIDDTLGPMGTGIEHVKRLLFGRSVTSRELDFQLEARLEGSRFCPVWWPNAASIESTTRFCRPLNWRSSAKSSGDCNLQPPLLRAPSVLHRVCAASGP